MEFPKDQFYVLHCSKYINDLSLRINSLAEPVFLISNFRRGLNVVFFLLGDSPAFEIHVPTFRNKLSLPLGGLTTVNNTTNVCLIIDVLLL
jgi:hypothetical protein